MAGPEAVLQHFNAACNRTDNSPSMTKSGPQSAGVPSNSRIGAVVDQLGQPRPFLQLLQCTDYGIRDDWFQTINVSAESGDLLNEAAAGIGVCLTGHDEDRFQISDLPIGHGQLAFVGEIRDVPYAPQYEGGTNFLCEINGKALVGFNPDLASRRVFSADIINESLHQLLALLKCEERLL